MHWICTALNACISAWFPDKWVLWDSLYVNRLVYLYSDGSWGEQLLAAFQHADGFAFDFKEVTAALLAF